MKLRCPPARLRQALAAAMSCGAVMSAGAQAAGQWPGPQALFQRTCAYCHDQRIAKGIGPELMGRQLPVALINAIVRRGAGAMPAFPYAQVGAAELEGLAQWIHDSPAPPAEVGR